MARWEHFEHRSDIGVRGVGATPAAAFEQAALALTAVITDPAGVQPLQQIRLECTAPDLESLLYEWLNSVIYEMSVGQRLFGRFRVSIDSGRLSATLKGESIDPGRHQPAVEIKGATYTEMRVSRQTDGTWLAQCVVDV